MRDLSEQVALVTGGNRGLGFEVCRQLADGGAMVLMGARDVEKGTAAAASLLGNVQAIRLDMSDSMSIANAAAEISAVPGRLDILVNNAAILNDLGQQPTTVSTDTLRDNLEVNFFGPWQLTAALAPLLKQSKGRVLNMATQVATLTQLADLDSPLKDDICPAYQASKIALNAMTVLFSKEFRESGARINSVCPGLVMTDMGHNEELPEYGDAARPQTPQEAVAAYLWLVEDRDDVPTAGFFTGQDRVDW